MQFKQFLYIWFAKKKKDRLLHNDETSLSIITSWNEKPKIVAW